LWHPPQLTVVSDNEITDW